MLISELDEAKKAKEKSDAMLAASSGRLDNTRERPNQELTVGNATAGFLPAPSPDPAMSLALSQAHAEIIRMRQEATERDNILRMQFLSQLKAVNDNNDVQLAALESRMAESEEKWANRVQSLLSSQRTAAKAVPTEEGDENDDYEETSGGDEPSGPTNVGLARTTTMTETTTTQRGGPSPGGPAGGGQPGGEGPNGPSPSGRPPRPRPPGGNPPDDPSGGPSGGGGGDNPGGRPHRTLAADEDNSPIAREADKISLPAFPNAANFVRWLRQAADEVGAASPYSDEAIIWMMSVLVKSFEELGEIPKHFKRLDIKLKAAVKRLVHSGLFAQAIDTRASNLEKNGLILRGIQIVSMIKSDMEVDQKSEHLYGFKDMNSVRLVGDDLAGMVSEWEATLARTSGLDEQQVLQPMLYGLIEKFAPLKPAIEHYDRNLNEQNYQYLLNACKKEVKLRLVKDNRANVELAIHNGQGSKTKLSKNAGAVGEADDSGLPAPTAKTKAKAKAKSKVGQQPNFDRADAIERGLCFAFQKGQCPLSEADCTFSHQAAKKSNDRTRSPSPPKLAPGTDRSKLPCFFFSKGKCSKGDSCEFSHGLSSAKAEVDD
jgi:hypothetical protein